MTKLITGMTRFEDAIVEQLHFADVDKGLPADKTLLMLAYKNGGITSVMNMPEVKALAETHGVHAYEVERMLVRAVRMVLN